MDVQGSGLVEKTLQQLADALPAHGHVLILPHNYPDPDALASSAAMELLLAKRFHLIGRIVFTGAVSRAENRELLRHYHYKWQLLSQFREPRARMPCVLIDTAPWSGNVTIPSFARPVAVFDHHSFKGRPGKWKEVIADIREEMGALASIMYEYLLVCGIPVPRWMATIMAYAIATETQDLSVNITDLDLKAYHDLMLRANTKALGKIRHAPLPRMYYALLQEAMQNAQTYGRVAWSHLNAVVQPEIVPEIADLLLRAERITWSFCTAWQQEALLISLRSEQQGAHCGSMLKSLIKKNGSAGGHDRMAAGFLDIRGMDAAAREKVRQDLIVALVGRIEKRPVPGLDHPEPLARTGGV